jgi:hypothetical protein
MEHDRPTVKIGSPADLLTAVPYLLGFHPTDSLVIVILTGTRVSAVARGDLPEVWQSTEWAQAVAARQVDVAREVEADAVMIIGYGPADRVAGPVAALTGLMTAADLAVYDALRVTDGRYFSYQCQRPDCCPPEGVPFDPSTNHVAATAVLAGQNVLPDRAALVATVAPVDGPARQSVNQATFAAWRRREALAAARGWRAVVDAGRQALADTFARYATGTVLDDGELAWLTVLLANDAVTEAAVRDTDARSWHIDLWRDITRRAHPDLAGPPASLLAFAAWRSGDGALAQVAVDRALEADPAHPLARVIGEALEAGAPPSVADDWPPHTPNA